MYPESASKGHMSKTQHALEVACVEHASYPRLTTVSSADTATETDQDQSCDLRILIV